MNFDVKRSPRRSRRDRDGVASMAPRLYGAYSTQDPSFFDDLDAKEVEVYKPFLKLEGDRLVAWRRDHPSYRGLGIPSSVFNVSGAFTLVTDVSSSKKGLRSGGTDDLEPAGDLLLKDLSSQKKEDYDFEAKLLPKGPVIDDEYRNNDPRNAVRISSYSLSALKAVRDHFTKETGRYNDAVSAGTDEGFQFNWLGKRAGSQTSLERALRCTRPKGKTHDLVAAYVKKLNAKIKELETQLGLLRAAAATKKCT